MLVRPAHARPSAGPDPNRPRPEAWLDDIPADAARIAGTMVEGFEIGGVALCVCDADDAIRFVNECYRTAFLSASARPGADFTDTMVEAIRAGTGIKLESMALADFAPQLRSRRRQQVGPRRFTADTADGRWWWVTDTKLPSGWLVAVAQDISAIKAEEFRLRVAHATAVEEAQTDALTGVPNRRHGLRRGEALFDERRAAGSAISLALIDMDHFKSINDRYGHDVGDFVLVDFARVVAARIGPSDQFSRIGGEEFLLVSGTPDPGPLRLLLADWAAALAPLDLGAGRGLLAYTVSVGLAAGRDGESWLGLLQRADMALYRAKAGGRARIEEA